jgi:uncharacterized protein YkwD
LRKLTAALLAVPIIAALYVPVLVRRSVAARIGLAIGIGGLVGVAALGLIGPTRTTATKPLPPVVPLTQAEFTSTIVADHELDASVDLAFSGPMDKRSVAASLDISPRTAVSLAWDATGSRLTVTPSSHWLAGTYYTVTVRAGALGESGRPMAVPARALFLTRQATAGHIASTMTAGEEVPVTTGFAFTFDRPVAIGDVRRALSIDPPLRGALDIAPSAPGTSTLVFTPVERLRTSTRYTVSIGHIADASGAQVAEIPALSVQTTAAPEVVRFRPKHATPNVSRSAKLSVRFTQSMDPATTKASWVVTANGKAVAGAVSFAEKNTVLVFKPSGLLPYGAEVMLLVNDSATSASGAPLAEARSVRFRIEPQPAPPAPRSGGSGSGSSGGRSVGGGSWAAVETYYLRLMNCTRTGGLVTSSGSCSSPGGRNVAALWIDQGISSKVSRPYAKRLAVNNQCSHFIGGNPGDRLRAAGYTSYIWAENLGCRSGDPYAAVLGSHLFFQSERSYNGGHYVNLMNSKYDRVGIGVWVSGGRVRLVIDFYHPR